MKIKISLILALRSQADIFRNLMQSLTDTTSRPGEVEIIIMVDADDFDTRVFMNECVEEYRAFNLRVLIVTRSEWFIRDYYNFAGYQSAGRWIMSINADSYFKTKNWDRIINRKMFKAARKFGDDILYGMVKDGLIDRDSTTAFSCWAMSSKEYFNLTGGVMDSRIAAWGADVALGKVFDLVDGGKRKVPIPEVFIDHISHHVYPEIKQGEHVKRFHAIVSKCPSCLTEEQMQESANKINVYLSERKRK